MRTRSIIWTVVALLLGITGYLTFDLLSKGGRKTETITIDHVNSPHNYKIKASLKPNQHVHNLKIVVRGSINDTATIGNVKLLPGKVDAVIYNSDWYSSDYELKYKPYKATEGNLKVELTFSYLQ